MTDKFAVIPSPSIRVREDLGTLLNLRGLVGSGVEIGTHKGEFAEVIMRHWKGKLLTCVDPWDGRIPEYEGHPHWSDNFEPFYQETVKRLKPFGERIQLMRCTSEEACPQFLDNSLDFVYIDGNHKRDFVEWDIWHWGTKVKPGGIVAGHDWNGDWADDVQPVVMDWARRVNTPIFTVPGAAASYYCILPV